MLKAALALAERGLAVFPCRVRDKQPATGGGFKSATRDVNQIKKWWSLGREYNIGIACGAVSDIFVVDVDGIDAEGELHRLEAELGLLPVTIEVITGKGRHLYFRYPGQPIRCTASALAPGIDTRGDGGYILAPPSVHPSGRRYEWSVDSGKLADAPAWLIEKLSGAPNVPPEKRTSPEAWVDIAAEGITEGSRDATLTKLAGYFLRRCITLDPLLLLELLQGWNLGKCRPPLPEADVRRIVNSICGREIRRRGL